MQTPSTQRPGSLPSTCYSCSAVSGTTAQGLLTWPAKSMAGEDEVKGHKCIACTCTCCRGCGAGCRCGDNGAFQHSGKTIHLPTVDQQRDCKMAHKRSTTQHAGAVTWQQGRHLCLCSVKGPKQLGTSCTMPAAATTSLHGCQLGQHCWRLRAACQLHQLSNGLPQLPLCNRLCLLYATQPAQRDTHRPV